MKVIKRNNKRKPEELLFKEISEEGWYECEEYYLLFLKSMDGDLDISIAYRTNSDSIFRVMSSHTWNDPYYKFVKLEDFSVEI